MPLPRRAFLRQSAAGFGLLGLESLFASTLGPKQPHFTPRVKRLIFLFMHGGPSSIDTFDPKPRLYADHGKPVPFQRGLTFGEGDVRGLMKPLWEFKNHGQSGIPVSSLFPHVATCADDLCVIRSMVGDGVDHGAALLQLHTGVFQFKRPSLGSWLLYGLGSENQNLPGFITIKPTLGHGGANNFASSFLPGEYQGTPIGHAGMKLDEVRKQPVPYLENRGLTTEQQRFELDLIQKMNRRQAERQQHDPDLEARIEALELAFRMQVEAPEAFEVDKESEATKKLYGLDNETTRDFGWQCLLARRLSERGVRFVQASHSYKWDQHEQLLKLHTQNAAEVDKPIAGLLKDLKARGLFKDTLVIWGGEFGRTPWAQGADGRDHNPYGYTIWMAGAGVKPGFIYGATDEFGYHAAENRMHIHDLHATLLHLMGLDHLKLTYRFAGRDFRLTDVAGNVHQGIFA
jgi:hypothetical protein